MRPYSKYIFTKSEKPVRFLKEFSFLERSGNLIPYFPSNWISFHRLMRHDKRTRSIYRGLDGITKYTRFLVLEDADYIGLYRIPELTGLYYGVFNNDAVLVKIEEYNWTDIKNITLWFFEGMHKKLKTIHHQCISGQLELD